MSAALGSAAACASSPSTGTFTEIDRERLKALIAREREIYAKTHPKSAELYSKANHLFGRVPMTWMNKWSGGFPLYLKTAHGNMITDVDGIEYVDFAMGDTAAMAGHSPAPTAEAVYRRLATDGGITTMMPTEDAEWVGAELTRRFGGAGASPVCLWSFTLTATDANRWAIRLARLATGRPKILVFAWCYHGSVDEIFAIPGPEGKAVMRPGNVAPPVDVALTTRVCEFNDVEGLKRELAYGDVAAVLMEPAMTNIGMVLPEPGFLEVVRAECDKTGTLLMIDETHTFSASPGGATAAWGLVPDIFIIGKSLGGGIPSGAYGITREVAALINKKADTGEADIIDVGGVGGTLSGNALSVAAMRATLEHVLTDDTWPALVELATAFRVGVEDAIKRHNLGWSITQLGTRTEYRFASPAPKTGTAAAAASDAELEEYLHLYTANRGVLITPFHNMSIIVFSTTRAHVDKHTELFAAALADLCSAAPITAAAAGGAAATA